MDGSRAPLLCFCACAHSCLVWLFFFKWWDMPSIFFSPSQTMSSSWRGTLLTHLRITLGLAQFGEIQGGSRESCCSEWWTDWHCVVRRIGTCGHRKLGASPGFGLAPRVLLSKLCTLSGSLFISENNGAEPAQLWRSRSSGTERCFVHRWESKWG